MQQAQTIGDVIRQRMAEKRKNEEIDGCRKEEQERLTRIFEARVIKDLKRTQEFLKQSEEAISKLESGEAQHPYPPMGKTEGEMTRNDKMQLLAMAETAKTLAFMPQKNDVIGISTGTFLTGKLVQEQKDLSNELIDNVDQMKESVAVLRQNLEEYKAISRQLDARIERHPQAMEEMRIKVAEIRESPKENGENLGDAVEACKGAEERINHHLKRVVLKIHAMLDWEGSGMADERTFQESVTSSLQFLAILVNKMVTGEEWVHVTDGMLVQLMHRFGLLEVREGDGWWVRLRVGL